MPPTKDRLNETHHFAARPHSFWTERDVQKRHADKARLRVATDVLRAATDDLVEFFALYRWTDIGLLAEGHFAAYLIRELDPRYPDIMEPVKERIKLTAYGPGRFLRDVFGRALRRILLRPEREGWADALLFDVEQDHRKTQYVLYASFLRREWKRRHLRSYPLFETFKLAALQYPGQRSIWDHTRPPVRRRLPDNIDNERSIAGASARSLEAQIDAREAEKAASRVSEADLLSAVIRVQEWEIFSSWCKLRFDRAQGVPQQVIHEIQSRYPEAFRAFGSQLRSRARCTEEAFEEVLVECILPVFEHAEKGDWIAALVYYAEHPRASLRAHDRLLERFGSPGRRRSPTFEEFRAACIKEGAAFLAPDAEVRSRFR